MSRVLLALVLLLGSAAARAETLYVTDVLVVLLRATPAPQGATVKQLASGAALEILEKRAAWVRVREGQGASGWIEARYLVGERPAGVRLAEAQAELARANARVAELERRSSEPAPVPSSPAPVAQSDGEGFVVPALWLAVSSAMLIIGFIAGAAWLRARTRRRLGGMTLNVSDL